MFKKTVFFSILATLAAAAAWAAPFAEEQAIDEQLGLFDRPWSLDKVNVPSRLDLPPQARGGFPPYDQEVETALRDRTPSVAACFDGQGLPC